MAELKKILELGRQAVTAGEEICLATVVGIEGSAYRRPGARLLLTSGGRRAGTISGGCLEAEVAKKAWWLTESGASLQRYSSFFDEDGSMPYGLGCGGTVIVLLERGEAAQAQMEALRRSVEDRTRSVVVTDLGAQSAGTVAVLDEHGTAVYSQSAGPKLLREARDVFQARLSRRVGDFFFEHVAPPPALSIFGAGDDVQPLVEFAGSLGWHVRVADGRAHLARAERFPEAADVTGLEAALAGTAARDAAVVMTHSYEQDRAVLRVLLAQPSSYIGVLGPRLRTERLAAEVAAHLGATAEECLARLHSPVGLDLGGHSPAAIALSITAELQAVFAGRDARKLTQVRLIHA